LWGHLRGEDPEKKGRFHTKGAHKKSSKTESVPDPKKGKKSFRIPEWGEPWGVTKR